MTTQLWAIIVVLISSLYGAIGPILCKIGTKNLSLSFKNILFNKNLILGYLIWGSSFIPLILAFKGGDATVLVPLMSTGYVWVILFSIRFLKERMNYNKWLGISFIVFGSILIGLGS